MIGPAVYFYTKTSLNQNFTLSKIDYLHFVPALLYALYSLVVFVTDKLILDDYYFYADGRDKDLSNWYQATGLASMVFYLLISLNHYRAYKKRIFNEVSYADSVLFKWVRNFSVAFLCLLILRVLFFILNPDWGSFGSQYWYYISFALVSCYIAIAGFGSTLKQITLEEAGFKTHHAFREREEIPRAVLDTSDTQENEERPIESKVKGTQKSHFTESELHFWKEKLNQAMREKRLYENPRLNLSDVANELSTNMKVVSTTVNRGWNVNFNDYVNQFRIEAIQKKLQKGEHISKTLLGVALESGFNSKATFNRAFKKRTSISPKEYLDTLSEN